MSFQIVAFWHLSAKPDDALLVWRNSLLVLHKRTQWMRGGCGRNTENERTIIFNFINHTGQSDPTSKVIVLPRERDEKRKRRERRREERQSEGDDDKEKNGKRRC
jgi:hypothetical protein